MKIYTKTGDSGETSVIGAHRVSKSSSQMVAIGDVDELNSLIGLIRSQELEGDINQVLESIQNDLFDLGAWLASRTGGGSAEALQTVSRQRIEALEKVIDRLQERTPEIRQFVLPDGIPAAAMSHLARTVCRRAERSVVGLVDTAPDGQESLSLAYLNRLSDLLFVIARYLNHRSGRGETFWHQNAP